MTTAAQTSPSPLPDIFAAEAAKKSPSLTELAWHRFRRDKLAMTGMFLLILLTLIAALATPISDNITQYSFEKISPLYNLKPSGFQRSETAPVNWLGTDDLGRDVLTRLIFGAQVSLLLALLTVALTLTIGTLSGAASGFFGGWVDTIITWLINTLLAIPVFFLLVLIAVVFRPPWWGLAIVLASVSWMGVSRLVRGEFLALKQRDFVLAATTVGAQQSRIIFRHILPNATSPMIVAATLQIGNVILVETALSYLGLGVQPPTPSWGNMLTNAQRFLTIPEAQALIIAPGVCIFLTVLAFNFVGNGLRDALDPRLKE
ncbi:MAG: ABC transporter permease [Chloroflexi bacterium]|nr:ABC transporter permease [Chloroflexota bacterium]